MHDGPTHLQICYQYSEISKCPDSTVLVVVVEGGQATPFPHFCDIFLPTHFKTYTFEIPTNVAGVHLVAGCPNGRAGAEMAGGGGKKNGTLGATSQPISLV